MLTKCNDYIQCDHSIKTCLNKKALSPVMSERRSSFGHRRVKVNAMQARILYVSMVILRAIKSQ